MPSRNYTRLGRTISINKINTWQDIIARVTVILMLCVQPLYFKFKYGFDAHGNVFAPYIGLTGHKYNFFLLCMSIVTGVTVLVLIAKLIGGFKLFEIKKISLPVWAALGFALVTLISALFSPYRGITSVWHGVAERHDGAITQLFYVVIFLIVAHWYKPRELDFVIFGISASCVGLIGVLQFYGFDFFRLWPNIPGSPYYVENYYHIYFRSTLGNINIVSTYVCVAILFCGFLFIRTESKWRYLWLAGSALNFWLMFLAGSDSGMVGTLAVMIFAVPFIIESRKYINRFLLLASSWAGVYTLQRLFFNFFIQKNESSGRIGLYATMTVLLLAGGLTLTLFFKKKTSEAVPVKLSNRLIGVTLTAVIIFGGIAGVEVLGRQTEENLAWRPVYEAREMLHGRVEDNFGSTRIYIWRNALEAFPVNPVSAVIGTGPDTFWEAFPNQEEALTVYGVIYDKAHNEYLHILVCQGILGLLCYLVLLGWVFIKVIPKTFKEPLLMAVLAAFTGYCVQAFFNINLPITSQMLWVMAGVMVCFVRNMQEESSR